jgi:copper chaperone
MQEFNFRIEGMHCEACVRRVSQALRAVDGAGVQSVCVGAAQVRTSRETITEQALVDAINKAGYSAFPRADCA